MKLKIFPLYPVLIAVFPVLALFSHNIDQVLLSSLLIPLSVVLAIALILWFISGLIMSSLLKGGLFTGIFLIIFFSYGHLPIPAGLFTASAGVGLIIAVFILILKSHKRFSKIHIFLNVLSIFLIASSLYQILPKEFSRLRNRPLRPDSEQMTAASADTKTPDIYYLIFDRYGNTAVLDNYLDYDNSEFLNYLEETGFYIADQSWSNYPKTFNSLASSLNFEYINYLTDELGEDYSDRSPFYNLMSDSRVLNFLKDRGYAIHHFGDWWQPTRTNKLADYNYNYFIVDLDEFSRQLIATTLAGPFYQKYFFNGSLLNNEQGRNIGLNREFSYVSSREEIIKRNQYRLDQIKQIPHLDGPNFIFAHILLPHDPFVFDPDCRPVDPDYQKDLSRDEKYVDQLICVNQLIKEKVDYILQNSAVEPIIIIQADEGPFPKAVWSGEKSYGELNAEEIEEKFGILNAYYLPEFDDDLLYPSISPVNTFRIVFNRYFGTDFEILADRHYNFESEKHPYRLIEVFPGQ